MGILLARYNGVWANLMMLLAGYQAPSLQQLERSNDHGRRG